MIRSLAAVSLAILFPAPVVCQPTTSRSPEYAQLQRRLAQGWNTWDTHSVTTHVLLPDGLAVRLGFLDNTRLNGEGFLASAFIGQMDPRAEQVFPGPHTFDGSYTDLTLTWRGRSFRVQSATQNNDLVVLVSPLAAVTPDGTPPMTAVFSFGYLWNQPGSVERSAGAITARGAGRPISFFVDGTINAALNAPVTGPYFALALDRPVALTSGTRRSVSQVEAILARQRSAYESSNQKSGGKAESVAGAIQTVLGWDTIYDPEHRRVISPVSRLWSVGWGGYVLFDWDTFFAASMAAIGDRDLAYADAIEMLNESTQSGFVPNYARTGWKSGDRSEPPVGAVTVLGLYGKFHDLWLLRDTFARLLAWNRWWADHRDVEGYLVWGSDARGKPEDIGDSSRGTLQGARFESGLDNSPMYDDVKFDPDGERMMLADVGLMGLYVADCDALATIAHELGKQIEAAELTGRASRYRDKLTTLWDEKTGMFLNKDLVTGKLSPRISPTNFYPLLARAATPTQAGRMVREHLENPAEFGGKFVLPSISRNDPAHKDQEYWRGRVWGPMNYLVYLGLRNYDQPEARKELAEKSLNLFLGEWRKNGHVHENYNSVTGEGDDVKSSDRFYHWGALLGLIDYLEQTDPVASR